MKAGISTACLYPMETEKALEQLLDRGFCRFEVFVNAYEELLPPVRDRLLALSREAEVLSLHPFSSGFETMLFFTDYPRRFRDGLELYRRFFDLAGEMGASYVVFHGAHRGMDIPPEVYAQRYGALHDAAREMGVMLLHENVERSMSRDPALLRGLRARVPDAGFVLDLKQAARAGVSPFAMAEAMGPGLRHVHVSDAGPRGSCLPVGQGTLDFPALLRVLAAQGFDGCLTLELYSTSYRRQEDLEDSVARLEGLIRQMAGPGGPLSKAGERN